jgi:anhydro-N-acetylmuramic acid kinase
VAWFIGLMSGTSMDGVDAVIADIKPTGRLLGQGHVHLAMPGDLRAELLLLNQSGTDEIHRAALATNALMQLYTRAVVRVLAVAGVPATAISALGAHGQTVRHRPGEFDGTGYTTQLVNGALLAELTGIDVVCDFRSRDVAAGGQGAPLVPAFHAACFAHPEQDVAVLNLGGIANLTLLPAHGPVLGLDTGPGNVLMDLWVQRHGGQAYDADGAWAAGGQVDDALLARLLQDEYFHRVPPKSTGRDHFHAAWLTPQTRPGMAPQAVMATLAELTAASVCTALLQHAPRTTRVLVCGGGAHNSHLMHRLRTRMGPGISVQSSQEAGVPPDQVEALAFAWLASAFMGRRAGNLPAVTGARGARVLGALYPAG